MRRERKGSEFGSVVCYGTTSAGGDATCSYYGTTGCGVVFKIILQPGVCSRLNQLIREQVSFQDEIVGAVEVSGGGGRL